jgi:hypothetical protein
VLKQKHMKITVCIGSVHTDTLGATIDSIKAQMLSSKAQMLSSGELIVAGQGDDRAVREVTESFLDDARIRYTHVDQNRGSPAPATER